MVFVSPSASGLLSISWISQDYPPLLRLCTLLSLCLKSGSPVLNRRRLLRVPWIARRSNQSILKEIKPEYSLEGPMLKRKLQYLTTWCEELTHWKRPWRSGSLKAGGERRDRGWNGCRPSLTQWRWVWANSGRWWTEKPGVLQFMGLQSKAWVDDWTTTILSLPLFPFFRS